MNQSHFWTPKKIRIFCLAVLAILGTHILFTYLMDSRNTSLLKRGDFASFYSAGMIVRQGLGAQLYDTRLLAYVQNLYWPALNGNYISFPYPPFIALMLAPFAYLPPLAAKMVFTLLMIFFASAALKIAGRFAPVLTRRPLATGVFMLTFYPISFGILGGQFTALNLLLYAGILGAYSGNSKKTDLLTGICLGLWCFKPQYAAALIFFFAAARAWKIVFTALVVAAVYYFLGALVQGFPWPLGWLDAAGKAASIDFPHNDFNMISLAGFFHAAGRVFRASGDLFSFLNFTSWILSAALLGAMGFLFWKAGKIQSENERRNQIQKLLELSAPVILLASPHALFYDLGICVIACARYFKLDTDRGITIAVGLTALAFLLTMFKAYLPLSPMIFYAAGALLFIAKNTNTGCRTCEIEGK